MVSIVIFTAPRTPESSPKSENVIAKLLDAKGSERFNAASSPVNFSFANNSRTDTGTNFYKNLVLCSLASAFDEFSNCHHVDVIVNYNIGIGKSFVDV